MVLGAVAFSSIISCILTLSAVGLLPSNNNSFGFTQGMKTFDIKVADQLKVGLGEDINHIVPAFATETQVARNSSDHGGFADIHSMTSEDAAALLDKWDSLLPIGDGFVPVQDPSQHHNLPPPLIHDTRPFSTDPQTWYSVAVFHQIHCLKGLLEEYFSHHGLLSPNQIHNERSAGPLTHSGHMLHCFDYLREAITCFGDTALEGSDPARGTQSLIDGTFGTGSKHICKNWKAVFDYAESVGNPKWGKQATGKQQHGA